MAGTSRRRYRCNLETEDKCRKNENSASQLRRKFQSEDKCSVNENNCDEEPTKSEQHSISTFSDKRCPVEIISHEKNKKKKTSIKSNSRKEVKKASNAERIAVDGGCCIEIQEKDLVDEDALKPLRRSARKSKRLSKHNTFKNEDENVKKKKQHSSREEEENENTNKERKRESPSRIIQQPNKRRKAEYICPHCGKKIGSSYGFKYHIGQLSNLEELCD